MTRIPTSLLHDYCTACQDAGTMTIHEPHEHDWTVVPTIVGPYRLLCNCGASRRIDSAQPFTSGKQPNETCVLHGHDWQIDQDELGEPVGVTCPRCLEHREMAPQDS